MSQTNTKPSPRDPSSAYSRMAPKWDLADALLGGTDALRSRGETYLPRHDKETRKNYDNRLSRATLVNVYEDTLDTLSGKPFTEDIVLGEDVPKAVEDLMEDVDQQGTALQPFCRAWFREAWAKAFSHVLVDHPIGEKKFDGAGNVRPRTLDDDRRDGLRPYWVRIRPENVLAAYAEVVDGRERLVHVRILEVSVERVGWEEVCVERIKVLEPGTWQVLKYDETRKEWVEESSGATGLDYIPLFTFYAGKRVGLHEAKPPLHDLAHLNISHWQSSSDQRNVLTVARFPILAASGFTPEVVVGPDGQSSQKVDIGPNTYLTTEAPEGKWYYVEHTGAAIEAGRKDLEDLERQMATYGAEFLKRRPGGETATGRALDSAEATSYLASTVMDFQDCVAQLLQATSDWLRLGVPGGTVRVKGEFSMQEVESSELDALHKARDRRDISRRTYLLELQRRKVLSAEFDLEADAELLEEEVADGMGGDMFGGGEGPGARPPKPPAEEDDDDAAGGGAQ